MSAAIPFLPSWATKGSGRQVARRRLFLTRQSRKRWEAVTAEQCRAEACDTSSLPDLPGDASSPCLALKQQELGICRLAQSQELAWAPDPFARDWHGVAPGWGESMHNGIIYTTGYFSPFSRAFCGSRRQPVKMIFGDIWRVCSSWPGHHLGIEDAETDSPFQLVLALCQLILYKTAAGFCQSLCV